MTSSPPPASSIVHADVTHVHPPVPAPTLHPIPHPNGCGQFVAVKEGYTLKELEGPRVCRRLHTFRDIRRFADYLNRHAADRDRCEILVDESQVVAGLQPRSVIGDLVTCDLVKTPSFEAWDGAFDHRLSQKQLLALVRSEKKALSEAQRAMLLGALRTLEVMRGGEFKSEIDETGATRFAAATQRGQLTTQIPPEFEITVPVYEGIERQGQLATYTIEVFITVEIPEKGAPLFVLEAPSLPTVKRTALREAAEWLQGQLHQPLLVALGTYKTSGPHALTTEPAPSPIYQGDGKAPVA